jgi:hypothetical protein
VAFPAWPYLSIELYRLDDLDAKECKKKKRRHPCNDHRENCSPSFDTATHSTNRWLQNFAEIHEQRYEQSEWWLMLILRGELRKIQQQAWLLTDCTSDETPNRIPSAARHCTWHIRICHCIQMTTRSGSGITSVHGRFQQKVQTSKRKICSSINPNRELYTAQIQAWKEIRPKICVQDI